MSFRRTCRLLSVTGKQDNEKIKKSIEHRNLQHTPDVSNNTLLHHAAKGGNDEIVQYLVDSGCKVDARNNLGQTALIRCLKTNCPCRKVIEILLRAGADIFIKDKLGKSALKIVDCSMWLSEDKGKFEIYKIFLEAARNFDDFKLLASANEKVIKMLLQTNVDLSAVDSNGANLVHALARNINSGIMPLLRGRIFDINARDKYQQTPLMLATSSGAVSAVKFLVKEGADIEAAQINNQTALYIAYRAVFQQAFHNRYLKCLQILLKHGADVQIETTHHLMPTIFDIILDHQFRRECFFPVDELALAHLALREASGAVITPLIRAKIESHCRFKIHFDNFRRQISTKIYRSITLFDILTASERQLERYLCDKLLASKLIEFQAIDHFEEVLRSKISKAVLMFDLRKTAASIIGELIEMNYDSYPFIAEEIVSYLGEKDLRSLISSQTIVSDDIFPCNRKFFKNQSDPV